jgi:hypothetical protein
MDAASLRGRIRTKVELIFASVPGTMIILRLSVFLTAISPTRAGGTAIFIPHQPNVRFVSLLICGLVKTGPGVRQLTLIFFFFS